MVGGAYCPLSSQDPPQRLQALFNQTQSRLIVIHSATHAIFGPDVTTLDIDTAMSVDEISFDINLDQLSIIPVTPENIVFVIFTSGSTGIPKAVRMLYVFLCIYPNMFW